MITFLAVMAFIGTFVVSMVISNRTRKVVYMSNDDGWIYIKDFPVPEEYFENDTIEEVFLTDGSRVYTCVRPKCNRKGEIVCGYNGSLAIAWRPELKPPKGKK